MLVGLHLDTIHVSTVSLVGLFQGSAGECRREYMARAPKRKRVQSPHWSRQRVQRALANVCRQRRKSAANAGGTTFNLEVPGSSPGRAFAAR